MLFNIKKINIQDNGVYILDENIKKEIKKKKLSASLIDSWLKSPADWVLNTYIYPLVSDKKETALYRGSMFHKVMEEFFALEPSERTEKRLKQLTRQVYESEEFADQIKGTEKEDRKWIQSTVLSYLRMNYDYQNEQIARIYLNGEEKSGIELFVSGKIGESERQVLGFIDKILDGPNGFIVQDWKSGAKVNNYDPTKAISESNPFDYWRQQTLYSMLLEKRGFKVDKASLIFPRAETEVFVDIHSDKVKAQVIKDVEQVDKELEYAINNNFFFPFKKGKYNKWAKYCLGWGNTWPLEINHEKFREMTLVNGEMKW